MTQQIMQITRHSQMFFSDGLVSKFLAPFVIHARHPKSGQNQSYPDRDRVRAARPDSQMAHHFVLTKPSCNANRTSAARVRNPSFSIPRARYVSTVFTHCEDVSNKWNRIDRILYTLNDLSDYIRSTSSNVLSHSNSGIRNLVFACLSA